MPYADIDGLCCDAAPSSRRASRQSTAAGQRIGHGRAAATEPKLAGECRMARLGGESSNSFFEALEEWQSHLAHHDLNDLRCDDDEFAP